VANKSLSPEPADPPWQVTSITTFQPSSLILYPDLWIPGNESVVTITAPRGAVINTYPGATTEAIPGRDEVKLTIKLPISILDTAPLDVVIETSPEWGRDPNFAILWGLSVSNVIAAVLGVLWAAAGALAVGAITDFVKGRWARPRAPQPPPTTP
jgi:hypothetical protein